MPFAGLGLHILLALCCAVHVVRTGQQLYWLFILFAFPLLGSLVYFFAIYLPSSRLERGARRAMSAAGRVLDPGRELREAREAFDATPTAQHQMRLAAALLDNGQAAEAALQYETCLKGPFASDPDMRCGAARAFLDAGRAAAALDHLETLRRERPDYRSDQIAVLRARTLAGLDRRDEARAAFEEALLRHGTFEAHAEYAIWALAIGDRATADRLQAEIDQKITRHWNAMSRELNEPVMRRLREARRRAG
ncbi:MAG TPA: hypothetical protein VJN44_03350 [Roseateles sp.]|nr:hypothetical protein [Roseateles sp.]